MWWVVSITHVKTHTGKFKNSVLSQNIVLPLNLVQESMDMLKINIPVGAENIVEYFSANDVEGKGRLCLFIIYNWYT